jgi:GDP-4-dehydro-6-deoxy-D-mannose reductase
MILVTGSRGLFGRALIARLVDEQRPYSVSTGDLRDRVVARDEIAACRPSVIVHLAGGRGKDRLDLYERNVLTTINVIEAAARARRVPAAIVMGSAAEYGSGSQERLAEDHPLRPVSDYGAAKVAETTLALAMGNRLSVPVTVLRPFNPVSPELGRDVALGNARAQLLENPGPVKHLRLGRLDVIRDFVPLPTIIEAIVRAAERELPGEVINICSGVGIALEDIVQAMAARLGAAFVAELDPELALLPAGATVVGDPARMKRQLGLHPMPTAVSLAEIMVTT